jgi:hypothetical protein
MNSKTKPVPIQTGAQSGFDMFRLSRAKAVVDVTPNTLRKYHKMGLNFYRMGTAVFVSRTELAHFIVSKAA